MLKFHRHSGGLVVVLLTLHIAVALSAQSKGIDPTQLAKAKTGDAESQLLVGRAYEKKQSYTQAAFWIRKAAESGNAEAQYKLGYLYSAGHGVPQNNNLAAVWWRKAADQGNANAQSSLGLAYINGDGVPTDFAEAAFWLQRSAEQGNAHGQALLSMLYEVGWGVPQDDALAVFWVRKAAEQGDLTAKEHLLFLLKK